MTGVPESKTFDVTLMICLIRNLTSISHPINGFDSLPLPGESTPGSDLARIKYYRNKLAHHDSNTIDSAYFNTAWGDISNVSINAILIKTDKAVGRLGGQNMYQECQILKMKILDQSNQEIILEIKQSLEEMKELRQTIDNLGTEHAKVTENLRELQSSHSTLKTSHNTLQAEHIEVRKSLKDPIPQNIKDQFLKQIADWKKKDTIQQLIQYLQQLDKLQQVKLANTKDTVEPRRAVLLVLLHWYIFVMMVILTWSSGCYIMMWMWINVEILGQVDCSWQGISAFLRRFRQSGSVTDFKVNTRQKMLQEVHLEFIDETIRNDLEISAR
ncbi:unnamed protein product [Mytilus edulis]|uniref:DZIP3-like HEPN domain-containing protein n=1 Tax=Mytilus edulis TaxID=6550 RepID=A0A8S3VDB8_MYTED|nr:unnamed protein product [Mytilus edulis]